MGVHWDEAVGMCVPCGASRVLQEAVVNIDKVVHYFIHHEESCMLSSFLE